VTTAASFATTELLTGLVVTLAAVVLTMVVAFVIGRAVGRYNVIDTAWGLGFVVVAVVSFVWSSSHGDDTMRIVMLGIVTIWGSRLAIYLGWRSRGKGEDPRYAEMIERADGSEARYAVAHIFVPQAAAMWFISLPVQVAMYERDPAVVLVVVGVAVWLVGLGFESVGDLQLARFRADPANRAQVMHRGLWRYTRHPNYFGDACVWWGVFLVACAQWQGLLTVLSPVLMTWTLMAKTGKPLLEKDMADRRPGYTDYIERTSGFVPRRPRRRVTQTVGAAGAPPRGA
jgi:steroid 5-alpha reductase family enzyme